MAKAKPVKQLSLEEDIQARYKNYKAMGAYKELTDIELRDLAEQKVKLSRLLRDLDIEEQFEDQDEKDYATELAGKYFSDYVFEFISDKNNLKELIFLEVLSKRIRRTLNEFYKDAQSVPPQMMEALHKNLVQIIELKKILGLTKEDKEATASEASLALDMLKKKFKAWRSQNQSRSIICPHCSKMVMLKIKTEAWEATKHPYFIDRFLGNIPLFDLLKDGTLTRQQVAKVLDTSTDYIDWITTKLAPNKTIKDVQTVDTVSEPVDAVLINDTQKDESTPEQTEIIIPSVFKVGNEDIKTVDSVTTSTNIERQ